MNYIERINLKRLRNAVIAPVKFNIIEKRCIIIPLDDNDIIEKNGGAYLDLLCYQNYDNKQLSSHYIKRYFNQDKLEIMCAEDKDLVPVIGYLVETKESQVPNKRKRPSSYDMNK